jgi:GxxExxY protein
MNNKKDPISDKTNEITGIIVDSALTVHRTLGPGLLERIYEQCMIQELILRGLKVESQIILPLEYKGLRIDEALRIDILVENMVIIEIKAVEIILPVHEAQLLTYLKLSDKRVGLLINFNAPLIKRGIKRIAN